MNAAETETFNAILSGFSEAQRLWREVGTFTLSARDLKYHAKRGIVGNSAALASLVSTKRIAGRLVSEGHVRPVQFDRHGRAILWTAA